MYCLSRISDSERIDQRSRKSHFYRSFISREHFLDILLYTKYCRRKSISALSISFQICVYRFSNNCLSNPGFQAPSFLAPDSANITHSQLATKFVQISVYCRTSEAIEFELLFRWVSTGSL